MRILLLSAYDAVSHRYWREGLVNQFPEYRWHCLELAPRYYSWRIRGNPLSWYAEATADATHALNQSYDLIIATSMVDISTLRGLFPHLASIPLYVFCHENQFAFPDNVEALSSTKANRIEAQMVFIYNCLAAERVIFNSQWNQDTAFQGIDTLFKRLPEKIPPDIVASIRQKTSVLSVPLISNTLHRSVEVCNASDSPELTIVWNHRWEFDKGPKQLLSAVECLEQQGVAIRWHIIGQQFRQQPEEFQTIRDIIVSSNSMQLGCWGFIEDRAQYRQCLLESDIVLSTSLHDFQGLAVLEAVHDGCVPLLPSRLVYPEIFSSEYLYESTIDELNSEAQSVAKVLSKWAAEGLPAAPCVEQFTWSGLKPAYAQLLAHSKKDS